MPFILLIVVGYFCFLWVLGKIFSDNAWSFAGQGMLYSVGVLFVIGILGFLFDGYF